MPLLNKLHIRICFFLAQLLFAIPAISQVYHQKTFDLNQPDAGNKTYIGRDYVRLLPGYHFKATASGSDRMHAYLDEELPLNMDYGDLFSDKTFDNRNINTSLPVGKIPGQHGVSSTGAATYNIPIELPPGTHGMVPGISVSYNSQAGNGLLGMGWNIGGISIIRRVSQSYYHDGEKTAVEMDYDDRFVLNGNRLMKTSSGTYGADGVEYGTEVESFSKITSKGKSGKGPDYFIVETKDGKTIEFGRTGDSQFNGANSTGIFWRINKVSDANGNYIEYKYKNDKGHTRIDEILYTGNDGLGQSPYNKVKFYYDYRNDRNENFIAGKGIGFHYLLRKIRVTSEGNKVRDYDFKYGYDLYSYLKEIILTGSKGGELNSTVFKYGERGPHFKYGSSDVEKGVQKHIYSGDYNGDGLSDILSVEYFKDPLSGIEIHQDYKVFLNKGGHFNSTSDDNGSFSSSSEAIVKNDNLPDQYTYYNSDFNGDGYDDFIIINLNSGQFPADYVLDNIQVFTSSGSSGTINAPTTFDFTSKTHNEVFSFTSNNYLKLGDFDGDGSMDFFTILAGNQGSGYTFEGKIISPRNNNTRTVNKTYVDDIGTADKTMVIDFNGDGKSEIMAIYSNKTEIYSVEINSANYAHLRSIYSENYPNSSHTILPGDFNGDGKTDLLMSSSNNWNVEFSSGEVFFGKSFPKSMDQGDIIKVGDFNGDGKSDVLHAYLDYVDGKFKLNTSIYYYNGKNNTFKKRSKYNPMNGNINKNSPQILGDFNGDGKLDIIQQDDKNEPLHFLYFNLDGENHLLERVKDGFNFETKFEYNTLSKGSIYNKETSASYPLNDFQKPIYCVKSVSVPDGVGDPSILDNKRTYTYEGAKVHLRGKGLLGFKKITTFNNHLNRKKITEIELNKTFYALQPKKIIMQHKGSTTKPISETTYTNVFQNLGNKRYFAYAKEVEEKDKVNDFTTKTLYTYDKYGNITNKLVNIGGVETIQTTSNYIKKAAWLPSRLSQQTIQRTRAGQSSVTQKTKYSYNKSGDLFSKAENSGTFNEVEYTYIRNPAGNIGIEKRRVKNISSILQTSIEYLYDSKNRLPIKEINLSYNFEVKKYDYDFRWGVRVKSEAPDGLTTTNQYNEFGERVSTTKPNGVKVNMTSNWNIQSSGAYTLFTQSVSQAGAPDMKTWHDILGREVKTKKQGYSQPVFSEKTYNKYGKIKSETSPYFQGGSKVVTTYSYENDFNRLKSKSNSAGTVNYSYSSSSGNTTVTTQDLNGRTSSKTLDPTGKVVSSTDNGGETLNFTYNSFGNKKQVSLNGTVISSMEYDQFGFQTKLIDKNAGTTEYQYDPLGRIIYQKDANGNTYNMTYDVLGRLLTKSGPGGNTNYSYISNGNGLNLLEKITGPNGSTKEYKYDGLNRMKEVKENIGGQSFTRKYQYDTYGNLIKLTYPSGFYINKSYNSDGYLTKVTSPSVSKDILTVQDMNAYGQYTQYEHGNNIITAKSFDKFGLLETIKADYKTTVIQDEVYDFDPKTGNLDMRMDLMKPFREKFTYDNQDRLTQVDFTDFMSFNFSTQQVNYTSDGMGNIASMVDVGSYTYDNAKINAVKEISPVWQINPLSQSISYTAFNKAETIGEGTYSLDIAYGPERQRKKTVLKNSGTVEKTTYYQPGYEKIIKGSDTYEVNYINCGDGLNAIYVIKNGVGDIYYTYRDHLGSITKVTDETATLTAEQSFDAWGRQRDPNFWPDISFNASTPDWLIRGYTGHEHLKEFDLINMNGRMYAPVIGRMLSPDNYVQSPLKSQSYNRYSYVWNNPLKYEDPSGEFLFAAGMAALSFTETGYDIQKYFSPVAVKVDLPVGSDQRGFGIRTSVGAPQSSPVGSFRVHGGVGYYWKNGEVPAGWQGTYGFEVGTPGLIVGTTYYDYEGDKFDQRTGHGRIGGPVYNAKYENDWFFGTHLGDQGDRYRTAAAKINWGGLSVGINLFTGDPGLDPDIREDFIIEGTGVHENKDVYTKPGVDDYRAGIGYIGVGPLRIGNDTEQRRHDLQNKFAHDRVRPGTPHFQYVERPDELYWQIGSGGGYLW